MKPANGVAASAEGPVAPWICRTWLVVDDEQCGWDTPSSRRYILQGGGQQEASAWLTSSSPPACHAPHAAAVVSGPCWSVVSLRVQSVGALSSLGPMNKLARSPLDRRRASRGLQRTSSGRAGGRP